MYKLSKYNYSTYNEDGDLLLYNSMSGVKSLLKVKEEFRDVVKQVLDGNEKISSLPEGLKDRLFNAGILVPEYEDEECKLRSLYLNCVANPSLSLTILPTEQCNFRCKYCYEEFSDRNMKPEVQDAVVDWVARNITRYQNLHVSWFGGEPLLELDIILHLSERLKHICRQHRKSYTASMTTNGYLLNMECFRKLMSENVLYYQITLDGLEDVHNAQRPLKGGGGSFREIIKNLEAIRDQVQSNLFRISLRTNFSYNLINRISEYKKFFGERFGGDQRFRFFIRPAMDWGGPRIDAFRDSLLEEELMVEIYRAVIHAEPKLHYIYDEFLVPGGGICYAGKQNHYTIAPNGDVFKCTANFSNPSKARVGCLLKDKIELDSYRCAEWVCNMEFCKNKDCFFAPNCLRDYCPAQRVLQRSGKIECPFEKKHLSITLQLLDVENQVFQEV